MRKLTKEEFIIRSRSIHENKYDYSKVVYINNKINVIIICPKDGEFLQRPNDHLAGNGCPKCGGTKKITIQEFIVRSNKVHNNKYDYSKAVYINSRKNIIIICPIHGEFLQTPSCHVCSKQGCPSCSMVKKLTTEEFVNKAIKIHGNKYDYSRSVYVSTMINTIIICPTHGKFYQTPNAHIIGKQGCPKCGAIVVGKKNKSTTEKFIKKSKEVHGNKYSYSKSNYINNHVKIIIICPTHGEFLQTPNVHLLGHGCPCCQKSYGELLIAKTLDNKKIK
jgi:hypothetical protein